jgi:hypothetical protein
MQRRLHIVRNPFTSRARDDIKHHAASEEKEQIILYPLFVLLERRSMSADFLPLLFMSFGGHRRYVFSPSPRPLSETALSATLSRPGTRGAIDKASDKASDKDGTSPDLPDLQRSTNGVRQR